MHCTRFSVLFVLAVVATTGAIAYGQAAAPATQPTTTPPAGGSASSAQGVDGVDSASSAIRLRRLEQRVQALKEQAWRVKARVGMLKEAVLGGGIGARAVVTHKNKMGGSFRLVKLIYALDGSQVFVRADDTGQLDDATTINILSGPIAPGNHTLSVLMHYRGEGYGLFSYLRGYKFTVRKSHTFTATEGKQTQITVVGYEKGGFTTPLEQRPAIDFHVTVANTEQRTISEGK